MDLPKKDKNGKNRLSYSQIETFKRSKTEFVERYILGKRIKQNPYIRFGSKVGEAIEKNDFFLFDQKEQRVLQSVSRLDLFEYQTILEFNDFNVYGFIDSCSFDYKKIIDYKTGGVGKHNKYKLENYHQLQIYALSLQQMHCKTPDSANVEFITRKGNPFKGEVLKVADEKIIKIPIDISLKKLDSVEIDIVKIAKEIDEFYDDYRNKQLKLKL